MFNNIFEREEDHGILGKQLLTGGTGDATPGLGYTVHVRYEETLLNDTVIKNARDKIYQYHLSTLQLPKVLVLAIASMKKGETAKFVCKPEVCYGKAGKPPLVPPNATIVYTVTLDDFTGKNVNLKFDKEIKKTIIKPGSGCMTPSFFSMVHIEFTATHDGRVFDDSSRFMAISGMSLVPFVLGESQELMIPEGVALALKDFKIGEKSKIALKSEYAFGVNGHALFKIPPYAEVEYIVTLHINTVVNDSIRINMVNEYLREAQSFYNEIRFFVAIDRYKKIINWLEGDFDYKDHDLFKKRNEILEIAYLNLALCYLRTKQPSEVLDACDGALRIDSKNEIAYYRKALAYLSLSEHETKRQSKVFKDEAKKNLWLASRTKSDDFNLLVDTKKLVMKDLWMDVKKLSDIDLIVSSRIETESDYDEEFTNEFRKRPWNFDDFIDSLKLLTDISPKENGQLLKEIFRDGFGVETPVNGSRVKIHYTAIWHNPFNDEIKVDSSRARNQPFEFKVGTSEVIEGWNIAVKSMKKGEIARFVCKSDYWSRGKRGSPPNDLAFPSDAVLRFEIQLLDWLNEEKEDLSQNKDKSITKTKIQAGRGNTKPAFGQLTSIHLIGKYNDREFDKRDVNFRLGDGDAKNIIEGVEIALEHFKLGEISKLDIKSKYAFGSDGNKDFGIPPNSDVEYTVTLKKFENDLSIKSFNGAQKLEKAKVFKEKGTSNFKKGRIIVALKMYKKALEYINEECNEFSGKILEERNSLLLTCYSNLAQCFLEINNPSEAKDFAIKALELDPTNEKALFRRGKAYLNLSAPELAMSDFLKVLEINPQCQEAANKISDCSRMIGKKFHNKY